MIIGKNISYAIDKHDIIRDASFRFKSGEVTSIIGPSGAGKSTILRLISLLSIPQSGSLSIGDQSWSFPSNGNDYSNIYPNVYVIFQDFQLWPHLTVEENILKPLKVNGKDISHQQYNKLLKRLNLAELTDRYPAQLSIGQKQRVAMVRGLMLDPQYLIMDEITSALDVEHIQIVGEIIKECKNIGTTVVLSTHLLGFAKKISDSVIFIEQGVVLDQGPNVLSIPKQERIKAFLENQ